MQKIIIKNFGAVKYAEIEIKKVLVLIGEQASGKSTIAKLIYFFKSLRDDVFNQIYQDQERDYFDVNTDVVFVLQNKFYNWFGSTKSFSNFEIKFYYDLEIDKVLTLNLNADKTLRCKLSSNFLDTKSQTSINEVKKLLQPLSDINTHERLAHEQNKLAYANILADELNDLFSCYQVDSLYIIAGRSATVSYSEIFEKHLFASVQSRLEKNSTLESYLKKQTGDEILMLKFMEKIIYNKSFLNHYEGRIEKFKQTDPYFNSFITDKHINREIVKSKIFEILKGEYINDNDEEKIMLNSQKSIDLRNSSSGQQEVIRVLQDILVVITKGLKLKGVKLFRVIEEPEAHLFPIAQKNLVELLALMVNQNDENQLIITTHSPYILTVFNNLLFAQRVIDKNPSVEPEVSEIIPKEFWLDPEEFSAYSLGNSSIEEEPEYCESIFNQKTGVIKQNYLDAVSEMLGGDFNALYSI
ncbi:MAG: ATP-binding protein [Pseudanabaena sp. CAN_BIN31]|nr:ATP-binding protein [Pseudanabaena sp. CAN_BIN31]